MGLSESSRRWRESERGRAWIQEYDRSRTQDPAVKEKRRTIRCAYLKNPINRFAHLEQKLRCIYGIDNEDWARSFEAQNGCCAICSFKFILNKGYVTAPCIDHSHVTGAFRQLLCRKCNSMIGLAGDSVDVLSNAIEYLRRHAFH